MIPPSPQSVQRLAYQAFSVVHTGLAMGGDHSWLVALLLATLLLTVPQVFKQARLRRYPDESETSPYIAPRK